MTNAMIQKNHLFISKTECNRGFGSREIKQLNFEKIDFKI